MRLLLLLFLLCLAAESRKKHHKPTHHHTKNPTHHPNIPSFRPAALPTHLPIQAHPTSHPTGPHPPTPKSSHTPQGSYDYYEAMLYYAKAAFNYAIAASEPYDKNNPDFLNAKADEAYAKELEALAKLQDSASPTTPCPETSYNVLSAFRTVPIEKNLCQFFDYDIPSKNHTLGGSNSSANSGSTSSYVEDNGFNCGLVSCLAFCYLDPTCMYAIFEASSQFCVKASSGRITDDPLIFPSFADTVVYVRAPDQGGPLRVPYFAGFCANKLPRQCIRYNQCAWDAGEQGYNDYTLPGFGFCGRTSCVPGCSDLTCT